MKTNLNTREPLGQWFLGLIKEIKNHKFIYIAAIPVLFYYALFYIKPIYGLLIAFKDYSFVKGVMGSPWTDNFGFGHFVSFMSDPYFFRILVNTLAISCLGLIFDFPSAIILALLVNEVRSEKYKKVIQTCTYLPHFISIMVLCSMIHTFVAKDGLVNDIIAFFGFERSNMLVRPELFRPIFIISGIWQGVGWSSIIYLAALSGIDVQLYEAAEIDGASKIRQIFHVTLPGILPTITIMFIMRTGTLLSVGYEKIILLYNEMTYQTADVISTFVYRQGLLNANYSYSAAVGMFNAVVNLIVLALANKLCRRMSETSLW
ncbi:MAG: sugar ABC transporter permease [Clostridia bacterium]|nr:sugar ABC transporter permease [Clostridia bacterium]